MMVPGHQRESLNPNKNNLDNWYKFILTFFLWAIYKF